jgi:hypothetical protein
MILDRLTHLFRSHWILSATLVCWSLLLRLLFRVPSSLRDLPRVPIFPLLWSYISGEMENRRLQRLILPFADAHGHGVVVVWAFGRWMIHVLDPKVRACRFFLFR